MLPRPRSYTTRSGCDPQQRAELFNCRSPCTAGSEGGGNRWHGPDADGEARSKTSDKNKINKQTFGGYKE